MTASIPFQCTVSPGASGYGSRRSHGQGQSQLEEGTIIVGRCVGVAGVIEPWKLASFLSLCEASLSGRVGGGTFTSSSNRAKRCSDDCLRESDESRIDRRWMVKRVFWNNLNLILFLSSDARIKIGHFAQLLRSC